MRKLVAAAIILAVTGCATMPVDAENPPVAGEGRCDAAATAGLVGQQATAALGADVLRLTGARTIRWIQPGTAVTMDYRMDRANVDLDGGNRVTGVRCG